MPKQNYHQNNHQKQLKQQRKQLQVKIWLFNQTTYCKDCGRKHPNCGTIHCRKCNGNHQIRDHLSATGNSTALECMICANKNSINTDTRHECNIKNCEELKKEMIGTNLYSLKIHQAAKFINSLEEGLKRDTNSKGHSQNNNSIEEIEDKNLDEITIKDSPSKIMHKITKLVDEKVNQQVKLMDEKVNQQAKQFEGMINEIKKTNKEQISSANVNIIEIQKTISTLDKKQGKVDEKIDEISDQNKSILQAIMTLNQANLNKYHYSSQPDFRTHPVNNMEYRNQSMNNIYSNNHHWNNWERNNQGNNNSSTSSNSFNSKTQKSNSKCIQIIFSF